MTEYNNPPTLEHSAVIKQGEYKKFLAHECKDKSKEKDPRTSTAIGGRLSYIYTPTGLGTCVSVKCKCGLEANITDTSHW